MKNIVNKIDHEELKTWMIMHMNVLVNSQIKMANKLMF